MKKILVFALALVMIVAIAVPFFAGAATDKTVYLKGPGSEGFSKTSWNDVYYVGDSKEMDEANVNVWHLELSGNETANAQYMQLTFNNGEVFTWNKGDNFSTNGGGKNPGWVIVAPYSMDIDYANNKTSGSYVIISTNKNVNFNISAFNKGTKPSDPTPPPIIGPVTDTIELTKTIDGKPIDETEYKDSIQDLIDSFELYKVDKDADEPSGEPISICSVADFIANGFKIRFEADYGILTNGWYIIKEVLTPAGENVFETVSTKIYVDVAHGLQYGSSENFDYSAGYNIVNGYSNYIKSIGYTGSGLNGAGDVFPIQVTNQNTGVTYESFCANGGSTNFAGDYDGCTGIGYYIINNQVFDDAKLYDDLLLAYNYIEANYGSLAANRVITQTVTWVLLGNITDLDLAGNLADERLAIDEILANYKTAEDIDQKITDLVTMICSVHGFNFDRDQPQLVPVYGGKVTFNNIVKDTPPVVGPVDVTFTKEIKVGEVEKAIAADQFAFEVYKEDSSDPIGAYKNDAEGIVTFAIGDETTPIAEIAGSYSIKEVAQDGWKPVDGLSFTVDADKSVAFDDGVDTIVNEPYGSAEVTFTKKIKVGEVEKALADGQFEFKVYKEGSSEPVGVYTNDAAGNVTFTLGGETTLLAEIVGSYSIQEVAQDGWKPVDALSFTVDTDGEVAFVGDTVIVNEPYVFGTPTSPIYVSIQLEGGGGGMVGLESEGAKKTGQAWFTYFQIDSLSVVNPTSKVFSAHSNGKASGATATISLVYRDGKPQLDLIVKNEKNGSANLSAKIKLSQKESDMKTNTAPGQYPYNGKSISFVNGVNTIPIANPLSNGFDLSQCIQP